MTNWMETMISPQLMAELGRVCRCLCLSPSVYRPRVSPYPLYSLCLGWNPSHPHSILSFRACPFSQGIRTLGMQPRPPDQAQALPTPGSPLSGARGEAPQRGGFLPRKKAAQG